MSIPAAFSRAVESLEALFDQGLAADPTPLLRGQGLPARREAARRALHLLLAWGRPHLEAERGLAWPWAGLERLAPALRQAAGGRDDSALQARLWLALLPFPGQWDMLHAVAPRRAELPEIDALLGREDRIVRRKLAAKAARGPLKPDHFLQVLKAPAPDVDGGGEPGVLRVFALAYALAAGPQAPRMLAALGRRYMLYVEPSMGLAFRFGWMRALARLPNPAVIGAAGADDLRFLAGQQGVVPLALCHADYLEDLPEPAAPKEFDIGCNGQFDDLPRKRQGLVLDALLAPELAQATALFLGRGSPEGVARFRRMVARRGLDGRVAVAANLPRAEVPAWLARCRVGAHASLNENGSRAIAEFLVMDVPVVVTSATAGVRHEDITPDTGALCRDGELAAALARTLDRTRRANHGFRPRQWFRERLGSANASQTLNRCMKALFASRGLPWTADLAPLTSSGKHRHAREADRRRLRPELAWAARTLADNGFPLQLTLD